ncbi:MAG: DUF58 domain-containing protein [Planctomycetes bacterium]|nr:DUF58 domain-containing protein [Planctomycetota bacterium]
MRPHPRVIYIILGLFIGSFIVEITNLPHEFVDIPCLLFIILFALDTLTIARALKLDIKRTLPHNVALGTNTKVMLSLDYQGQRKVKIEVYDHYPVEHTVNDFPLDIFLDGPGIYESEYTIHAKKRGLFSFSSTEVRYPSRLGLWRRTIKGEIKQDIRVYPNYKEQLKLGLLFTENRLSDMGIHRMRMRGEGTVFNQLRDFRKGDTLSKVDWKATARVNKPIAKDFQLETQQQAFVLLDSGVKMSSEHQGISLFDQALNSLLLLSYIVQKQGDAFGFLSFGGTNKLLRPACYSSGSQQVLHHLYDLEVSDQNSDYLKAAAASRQILSKRSLVIILTNIREEESPEILAAMDLLKRKHIVVLASFREPAIDQFIHDDLIDTDQALSALAARDTLAKRYALRKKLIDKGVRVIDCLPQELPISLCNEYLYLKSSGLV